MRKILYLNGYQSKLIAPKQEILEKHGVLIAPFVDHHQENDIYLKYEKLVKEKNINLIIGSSMGGALGFLLSSNFNLPALLFNPALPYYEVDFNPKKQISAYQKCILGKLDSVINPNNSLTYLNSLELPTMKIEILPELKHQIPVSVFNAEIEIFIHELERN